jgi:hypothetical protein
MTGSWTPLTRASQEALDNQPTTLPQGGPQAAIRAADDAIARLERPDCPLVGDVYDSSPAAPDTLESTGRPGQMPPCNLWPGLWLG